MQQTNPKLPLVIHSPEYPILEKDYPPSTPIKDINGDLARSLHINGEPAFSVENGERKAVFDSAQDHAKAKQILSEKLGIDQDSIFIASLLQGIEIFTIANYYYVQIEVALAFQSEELMITMRQDSNNGTFNLTWEKEKSILVGTFTVGMNFVQYGNEKLPDDIELTVKIKVQKDGSNKPILSRKTSVICNFSNNDELLKKMQAVKIFIGLQKENIIKLISGFITQAIQSKSVTENKFKPPTKPFKPTPKDRTTNSETPKKTALPLQEQQEIKSDSADFFERKNSRLKWIPIRSFEAIVLLKHPRHDPDQKDTKEKFKEITAESLRVDLSKRLNTEILELRYDNEYDEYELGVPAIQVETVRKKLHNEVTFVFEQNKKDAANITSLLKDVLDSALPISDLQSKILADALEVLQAINWIHPDIAQLKQTLERLKTQQALANTLPKEKAKLFLGLTKVVNALSTTYTLNEGFTHPDSLTPWLLAASQGKLTVMKSIYEASSDKENLIHSENSMNGYTALHYAIRLNNIDLISWLLTNGADSDLNKGLKDSPRLTPWTSTLMNLKPNIIEIILKKKPALLNQLIPVIYKGSPTQITPLEFCLAMEKFHNAKFLLSQNPILIPSDPDPDKKEEKHKRRDTALHLAAVNYENLVNKFIKILKPIENPRKAQIISTNCIAYEELIETLLDLEPDLAGIKNKAGQSPAQMLLQNYFTILNDLNVLSKTQKPEIVKFITAVTSSYLNLIVTIDRTWPTIDLAKIWGKENAHHLVRALSQTYKTEKLFDSRFFFFSKRDAHESLAEDIRVRAKFTNPDTPEEALVQAKLIVKKF